MTGNFLQLPKPRISPLGGLLLTYLVIMLLPSNVEAELVLWNKLGSQTQIENSEVGINGTFCCGNFVTGVFGDAYSVEQNQGFTTRFPKEVIPIEAGAIEFWAKLTGFPSNLTSGPNAAEPRLFRLQHNDGRWALDFRSNDGLGGGGLIGEAGSGGFRGTTTSFSSLTYEQILGAGEAEDWHHYALVWDKNGIVGVDDGTREVSVFLDGNLNSTRWLDGTDFKPITSGELLLAFNPDGQAGSNIAIDNFKIYDFAKTDFSDRFDESAGFIPLPPAVLLFGSGLLGLIGMIARRKASSQSA